MLAKDYVRGSPIRQEFLEIAIKWIANGEIEKYMSIHQHDPNANELWIYFRNVIEWVKLTFTTYRREMKGLDWGGLYDEFKGVMYDTDKLEKEIQTLMMDDDVTNKRGIYPYVLTRKERYLNIRAFTESQKRQVYEKQKGICKNCGEHFKFKEMHGDHITPWSRGGKTDIENCQMLCQECNRRKSNI
ncbi:MAG TPA: HNH endonuclease signature motif containing protein [Clostridia bacterium]|nr:HNH endonuclease signature motif containing protein [Clostridia bacterium]